MLFGQKAAVLFVNFLKRGFVFRVNLRGTKGREGDFFEIVFLDNFFCLCYYIIYIWENSAQNRPIGGVCLTRWRERISWSRPLRARTRRRTRPQKWFASTDVEANEGNGR